MADEIDDLLQRTMKTLDDQVPSGYFEDLPQRTLGRLEVSLMQTGSDQEPVLSGSGAPVPPEEDSGLHDIRSLAQTTKQRISSRKITNTATVDDDVVANSSSGWKAVALPEPAKMIALPDIDDLPVRPRKLAEASAVEIPDVTPIGARVPKRAAVKRRNGMIATVGIGLAAAAGLVLFVATRNKADQAETVPVTGAQPAKPEMATPPPGTTVTPIPPQQLATDKVGTAVKKGEIGGVETGSAAAETAATMDAGTTATGATGKDITPPPTTKIDKTESLPVKQVPTRGMTKTKTVPPSKKGGKSIETGKPDAVPSKTEIKSDNEDKKPSKKGKSKDEEPNFDDLLKDAGETTKTPVKPKLDKKSLSADDFKAGMGAINGRAIGCYKGTPGTVSVRVAIGPDGHVQKVTVTGPFAGTPSGDCVAAAVKGATFPPWDGSPQSFGYSFLLSE
jgi:outer membrane biosynthesis protein TonB